MTFKEAYDKTGIHLNIAVTDSCYNYNRFFNHIKSPNVYIWSACLASCSLPYIYGPSKIFYKKNNDEIREYKFAKKDYFDGSIAGDVPKR